MKIHEYQAKQILREAGVAVPRGIVVDAPRAAAAAFHELGGLSAVVKAQVHAGGRGKGTILDLPEQHGVQVVGSPQEAAAVASNMLGHTLVTAQTGPRGSSGPPRAGRAEPAAWRASCTWASSSIGPRRRRCWLPRSTAAWTSSRSPPSTPEAIFRETFSPDAGLRSFQARKLAQRLGLTGAAVRRAEQFMRALCRVFVQRDLSLAEINPLVLTAEGELLALDAKMSFDDNALFRQPEAVALRDLAEEEPAETRASQEGLSYVRLDGNIGCLVNGAGLAMSTMDLIQFHGGRPANFLDVGGGANVHQVTEAFRILLDDPERPGGARQHLWRDHALHDHRRGPAGGVPLRSASACRWSCGWKGPKSRKGARSSPKAA